VIICLPFSLSSLRPMRSIASTPVRPGNGLGSASFPQIRSRWGRPDRSAGPSPRPRPAPWGILPGFALRRVSPVRVPHLPAHAIFQASLQAGAFGRAWFCASAVRQACPGLCAVAGCSLDQAFFPISDVRPPCPACKTSRGARGR
jgi:hypothetical protein